MNLHDLEAELIRGLEMGTWAAAKVSMQVALRMVQVEMEMPQQTCVYPAGVMGMPPYTVKGPR